MEWNFFDAFLGLVMTLYALMLAVLSFGLWFYRPKRFYQKKYFLSVIVAARNEENRIGRCIEHLTAQSYPRDHYEVIVVDDRSSDQTASVVREFQKEFNRVRLISIKELSTTIAPKKNAIQEGIKAAQGEILICTDADCRPDERWLEAMSGLFTDEVGMVVGFSPIEPRKRFSLFDRFIALDSIALASVAAAGSALGVTLTATGRSLAYRKRVFDEVGGFSKIARFISGDDDLLLGLVRQTQWKTAYCMEEKSMVYTDPPESFRSFIHQKIRQASKTRHYGFKTITGLILIYLLNASLITYLPAKALYAESTDFLWFYVMLWVLKAVSDFLILSIGAARFKKWNFLIFYPAVALIHPWYITVFGAWGLFGKFRWK